MDPKQIMTGSANFPTEHFVDYSLVYPRVFTPCICIVGFASFPGPQTRSLNCRPFQADGFVLMGDRSLAPPSERAGGKSRPVVSKAGGSGRFAHRLEGGARISHLLEGSRTPLHVSQH